MRRLKTRNDKKTETCEYKIDTGSDGTLMPIRMSQLPFPYANITKLKMSIEKNIIAHLKQFTHTTNGNMQSQHNY